MNILSEFVLNFATEGLGEIAKDIKDTEQEIERLETKEKSLNETIEKGGEETEKYRAELEKLTEELKNQKDKLDKLNKSWESNILNLKKHGGELLKIVGHLTALGFAVANAIGFAESVNEIANAAEDAKVALDDLQKEELGRVVYSRKDVNNAKDYEMVLRDIRNNQRAISANLGSMLLPALTGVMKIVRSITDFFAEHYPIVRMGIVAIGTALAVAFGFVLVKNFTMIKTAILGVSKALWSLVANPVGVWIAVITALVVGLILVLDDLYAWFTGGESALAGWWDKVFGGVEGAKELVNDFRKAWEKILPVIKWIGDAILWVVKGALKLFISALILIPTILVTIIAKVLELIAWLGKLPEKIKTILHISTKETVGKPDGSHADGLDYVPFDGYRAILHKGERVQTADEAEDWRTGLLSAKKAINFTAQYPLNAIPQGSISTAYNTTSEPMTVNIGDITIQTQATDAEGIATDLASYIKQAVISLDDGMLA